jgi:hypothetical protein
LFSSASGADGDDNGGDGDGEHDDDAMYIATELLLPMLLFKVIHYK